VRASFGESGQRELADQVKARSSTVAANQPAAAITASTARRHRLGVTVRYLTRNSHRELLTAGLAPMLETLAGDSILDVGSGRDSALSEFIRSDLTRIRLDISTRFTADVRADAHASPSGTTALTTFS
jgi:hypothetical protein